MVFKKKGQAALEFLTTYGWAFLIILVMIGALAYFGVLDPSNFVAERCVAKTPLACEGQSFRVNATNATVQLRNGFNKDLELRDAEYLIGSGNNWVLCDNYAATNATIPAGRTGLLNCGLETGAVVVGQRERIEIRYQECTINSDPTCQFARTGNIQLYVNIQE